MPEPWPKKKPTDWLKNIRERGVALEEGQTLRDLYDERTALYEQYADLIIDEGNMEFEEVLNSVLVAIRTDI